MIPCWMHINAAVIQGNLRGVGPDVCSLPPRQDKTSPLYNLEEKKWINLRRDYKLM